jgi:glycosyltransferase involved in cell wall biosynthesis
MRQILQRATALGEAVPNESDVESVLAWSQTSGPHDAYGLGRYLTQVWWERPDLQEAFPGIFLDPDARTEFRRWAHHFGAVEAGIPAELVPAEPPALVPSELGDTPISIGRGVTCVGYHRAVLGVGAAGRRLAFLLETAGERVHRRTYDHTTAPLLVPFDDTDAGGTHAPDLDLLVMCVNGSETPRLSRALGVRATASRYRIGLWGWELETFPPAQQAGFAYVDEVWTYSEFARAAIARVAPTGLPVHAIPLGADLFGPDSPATDFDRVGLESSNSAQTTGPERVALGLPPTGPLIGFVFDFASSIERKNPAALVAAYRTAVPAPSADGPTLVLKTLNTEKFPDELEILLAACGDRSDIVIVDRTFSAEQLQSFISSLCAYISLHRSEGYGLTLLEAMAWGVPVIATAYSGNLDFMTSLNSWLIPYRLVPTTVSGQYPEGLVWAEADVEAAALAIREVLSDSAEVRAKVRQARRDALALVSPATASGWIRSRLAEIRSETRIETCAGPSHGNATAING